jgi:amidohydrolase
MNKNELQAVLSNVRRTIHAYPEVGFDLERTRAYLTALLQEAGCQPRAVAGGLVADLGSGPGRVLLRAELDALPLTDGKKVNYASQNAGACHACGHDGHMAMLYGALLLLKENPPETGGVRLLLQPAEESPPGGALGMLEAGVLDGVRAVFALHLNPGLPYGKVGVKPGVMMAAADNFRLTVLGSSGHGAMPQGTVDAVLVAAHAVTALQALVSRYKDPLEPLVVTVGKIRGGTANNVVADKVVLEGTVRTLDRQLRQEMPGKLEALSAGVCAAFGARLDIEYLWGYPLLINNRELTNQAAVLAKETLGADTVLELERPLMGGEDFAYFLEKVPGTFLFLGTGCEQFRYPLHHCCFDFNEDILVRGASLLAALAKAGSALNLL